MKGGIFTLILLCLSCPGRMLAQESPASAPAAYETADRISGQPLKKERGLISLSNTFVPKGQWVAGMTASFSTHSNKDYTFVVIEGINSEGHTVKIAPVLAYAVANNMALGARFTYSRTYLRIDSGFGGSISRWATTSVSHCSTRCSSPSAARRPSSHPVLR